MKSIIYGIYGISSQFIETVKKTGPERPDSLMFCPTPLLWDLGAGGFVWRLFFILENLREANLSAIKCSREL